MDFAPYHNQNNVDLSILLDDSVMAQGTDNGTRAASDGTVQAFASAAREYHLYQAYTWVAEKLYEILGSEFPRQAPGLIVQAPIATIVSAGTAVPGDFLYPLWLSRADISDYPYELITADRKNLLDSPDSLPSVRRAYTVLGKKIFVYKSTSGVLAQLTSGTYTLGYIKSERIDPATGARVLVNSAPDITLDRQWHNAAVRYAASQCALNKGDARWTLLGEKYLQQALACLPSPQVASAAA